MVLLWKVHSSELPQSQQPKSIRSSGLTVKNKPFALWHSAVQLGLGLEGSSKREAQAISCVVMAAPHFGSSKHLLITS